MNIDLPTQPTVISENEMVGTYVIEKLHPGYGQTLGNSLRRVILSSLSGAAITSVKIKGAGHEFTTLDGVKEDVVRIILNLKGIRIKLLTDGPVTLTISEKGEKTVTAGDIETNGTAEILNPEQEIATITDKKGSLEMELEVESGIGYLPRELQSESKSEVGSIPLDAVFTPVRKVLFEVENMRVGDRTDFNRLKLTVETDGTISPREALEKSVQIMIKQLSAIIGVQDDAADVVTGVVTMEEDETETPSIEDENEARKTRVESLDISPRTRKALEGASIRTAGGLASKSEEDILQIEGLGDKGVEEIKTALKNLGLELRS